jgi:hypothetical protein
MMTQTLTFAGKVQHVPTSPRMVKHELPALPACAAVRISFGEVENAGDFVCNQAAQFAHHHH